MSIVRLDIHHLRLISSAQLAFHPRYNVISGDNGSGKTSLLEAIYLLGTGSSFKTRDINAIVSMGQQTLTLYAKTQQDHTLSLQKSAKGIQVKLNQQPCSRRSELAAFLPCQVFYQDIFSIIDAGPSLRRNILDWGLFHVKHEYHQLWKDYRRILKQRNALLRQKAIRSAFAPWNKQLVEVSEAIDYLRKKYCEQWFDVFQTILSKLTNHPCQLIYEKGWDKKKTGKGLHQILDEQYEIDSLRQYTHSGAHQADIVFDAPQSLKVKQCLSRGQQKILLIALKLAQTQLISSSCLYLFDDITSELDLGHVGRFLNILESIQGQIFFTAIHPQLFQQQLDPQKTSFFTLENGEFV